MLNSAPVNVERRATFFLGVSGRIHSVKANPSATSCARICQQSLNWVVSCLLLLDAHPNPLGRDERLTHEQCRRNTTHIAQRCLQVTHGVTAVLRGRMYFKY